MTSGEATISTLVIPNVTKQDVGKYYCQVWTNNIGTRSKKANLYYSGMYVHIAIMHNCNHDIRYTNKANSSSITWSTDKTKG